MTIKNFFHGCDNRHMNEYKQITAGYKSSVPGGHIVESELLYFPGKRSLQTYLLQMPDFLCIFLDGTV